MLAVSIISLAAVNMPAMAGPGEEARKHVDMAQTTLSNFMRDPNMAWIQANLANAKGTPSIWSTQDFFLAVSDDRADQDLASLRRND